MRNLTARLITISLLCLFAVGAYAKDNLKEHVTFSDDLLVGSTLVKKGDYMVRYDPQTKEVSFMDMNKHKVVATAMASVKVNDKKAESDVLYTTKTPAGEKLTGLKLGGQREELTLTDTAKADEEIPITDLAPISDLNVEIPITDTVERPITDTSIDMEASPICEWEAIPLSDDMEEVVVSDVDGIIPDAEIVSSKLVCQPW